MTDEIKNTAPNLPKVTSDILVYQTRIIAMVSSDVCYAVDHLSDEYLKGYLKKLQRAHRYLEQVFGYDDATGGLEDEEPKGGDTQ